MANPILMHYGQALFEVGVDDNQVVPYLNDLVFLNQVFQKNIFFLRFLDSPMIEDSLKNQEIDTLLKAQVHVAVIGFLKILAKQKLCTHFPEIVDGYRHCYDESIGVLEGRVYSAFPLSDEELMKLQDAFSVKYSRRVQFRVILDKKVLAGMKIFIDETLYDYSLDTKINTIKKNLTYQKS